MAKRGKKKKKKKKRKIAPRPKIDLKKEEKNDDGEMLHVSEKKGLKRKKTKTRKKRKRRGSGGQKGLMVLVVN